MADIVSIKQATAPAREIPAPLRCSIRTVGVEYVRAFNADAALPLPQVISEEILKAIVDATKVRSVK